MALEKTSDGMSQQPGPAPMLKKLRYIANANTATAAPLPLPLPLPLSLSPTAGMVARSPACDRRGQPFSRILKKVS
jgi:hypothetical protein